jgi:Sensors of blue-light using FAD
VTRLNMIFVSALLNDEGQDLPAILESAASSQSDSVHSMILYSAGNVMQFIDGEASEARSEFKRLFQNAQYVNSIVLSEEEVEAPSLSRSSLGASRLQHSVIEKLPRNVAFFKLSESAVAQRVRLGIARNLLRQFAADNSGSV